MTQISEILNISRKQLYIWKKVYNSFLISNNPFKKVDYENLRKKRIFDNLLRYKNILIDIVDKNRGCSLIDIYKHINKEISISSLCRLLKELRIVRRRKRMRRTRKTNEQLENLRKEYMKNRYWNPLDEAVYIDEVHFSVRDLSNYC